MSLFFVSVLTLFFLHGALYGQVRINELQAANTSSYADMVDFEDYADWLELYNTSATRIDLSAYYLTDNLANPLKWKFPAGTTIEGHGYLVVWADQRDAGMSEIHRRPYWPWAEFVTKGLHANFKLSSTGEELGLFHLAGTDTVAVDSLRFGRQSDDVSWGRRADTATEWVYFGDPTPGFANETQPSVTTEYAAAVNFSQEAAFFAEAPLVSVTTSSPDAAIYYSTDGSNPTPYAPTSQLYSGPIRLAKNSVLKARAYEKDKLPGPVKSQTYFVGEPNNALPILSYSVDPKVFWDVEKGIYRNSLKQREVPVFIEFFARDRTRAFAVEAGSRIGGLNIWRFAQKPLTLYLRDRYGADALNYPLFAGEDVGVFARFALRNGGDDWPSTMLRDPLAEGIAHGQMQNGSLAYRPVSVFINGSYWGIHNLRERFDEQYFLSHFNVSPSQYTHLEWVAVESESMVEERFELAVVNGQPDDYLRVVSQLSALDMSSPSSFEFARENFDLDSYIDFLALEEYAVNTSWFHNRELWRENREGARWQWLLTDLDKGFLPENIARSLLEDLKRDPVYAQLVHSAAFRERFVQRYTAHLNNTFSSQRLTAIADSLAQAVAPEIPRHAEKWSFQGGIASLASWRQSLGELVSFMDQRAEASFAQIGEFFALQGYSTLQVQANMAGAGDIYINGVRAVADSGRYFHAVPIELTAVPRPGYRFVGWDGEPAAQELIISLSGDRVLVARFEKSGDSEIPPVIENTVTLKKEDSPYYAAQDIRVGKGALLRIEAGVEIRMPKRGSLYVEGQLEIMGSEEEPVRMVPNTNAGVEKWGALCFVESSDTSTVRHLYLRNASHGADPLEQIAAISAQNSHIVLDHIDMAAVDFPIFVRGGSVALQNSQLHADATSDYINVKNGSALVEGNVFAGNDAPDTDGIDYDGVIDGIIRNNVFYNFTGSNSDAIDIGEGAQNILIADNGIFHMSDKGISIGQRSTVRVLNNAILECTMGVAVKDSSYAYIAGNTFYGNALAVACFEKNIGQWGGRADVSNSILASSSLHSTLVDPYSELSIGYSLSNTDTLVGVGNLFGAAGFTDARRYDLTLKEDSPALAAGRAADGSVVDMGADAAVAARSWPEQITRVWVPTVLISEIMYRASGDFDSGDWIELHNTTESPLSLAGWFFTDSDSTHRFEFLPDAAIEARGYLVVARDLEQFHSVYPMVENAVGDFAFGLAPKDHIKLYNGGAQLVSDVAYSNALPWPLEADGLGASLTLASSFYFNRHVDNWLGSEPQGSPGRGNFSSTEREPAAQDLRIIGNGPNPFGVETALRYSTATAGAVKVEIYNIAGQRLIAFTREKAAGGAGEIVWDGRDGSGHRVAAGVYLYTLSFKGEKKSARMLVLR